MVDKDNKIVFTGNLKDLTWSGAVKGENGSTTPKQDGNQTFEIKVPAVEADKTYRVYFLAGNNKPAPEMDFTDTNKTSLQRLASSQLHSLPTTTLLCSTRTMHR